MLKTGQGIESYWSRQKVPYINYSACKKVLTGSFGTPCFIQSVRMTSCMGRWSKRKETVGVNIHQYGKPRCCILTCRDVGRAMWQTCFTTSCRIVVSLSVCGVVQHGRSRCPCSGVIGTYHTQLVYEDLMRQWTDTLNLRFLVACCG